MRVVKTCRSILLPTVCCLHVVILGSISFRSLMGQARTQDGTFTDARDGSTYPWIRIESQIWMAENLRFATEEGSWCYEDLAENRTKFGRLYDWPAAMIACPAGWHLPTSGKWDVLEANLAPEAERPSGSRRPHSPTFLTVRPSPDRSEPTGAHDHHLLRSVPAQRASPLSFRAASGILHGSRSATLLGSSPLTDRGKVPCLHVSGVFSCFWRLPRSYRRPGSRRRLWVLCRRSNWSIWEPPAGRSRTGT